MFHKPTLSARGTRTFGLSFISISFVDLIPTEEAGNGGRRGATFDFSSHRRLALNCLRAAVDHHRDQHGTWRRTKVAIRALVLQSSLLTGVLNYLVPRPVWIEFCCFRRDARGVRSKIFLSDNAVLIDHEGHH